MKRIYKRTFYYKYSALQKFILSVPAVSLVFLLVYPLSFEEAKLANLILFSFSGLSLLLVINKRNYLKWDLNEIEIKVKGTSKTTIRKDKIDEFSINNRTFIVTLYSGQQHIFDLSGLKSSELDVFCKTFKEAINESEKTEILFHNYNKMSLIYRDDQ
ncbi:hypothetical protein [Flammeovirga sp. SJP92]|uniref:hypothetical protein n=1 Tax=Flammeovirga sp. SJP92 TaxID=1775430 RepID=UPI000788409C|nr:hypothetical protein [Flammeovirga sp. SJP92]KXX70590.1 hypothetical protein AVL50_08280 [Flammeovirga sp. SJP92]